MLNPFRTVTTSMKLDKQIALTEESLISNAHNAEHFTALAQANRKQLTVLRAMKALDSAEVVVTVQAKGDAKTVAAAIAKDTKPRLASSNK